MAGRKPRAGEVATVRPAQPRSPYQALAGATERRLAGALEVPLEQVLPDPAQPRRDWDHAEGRARLEELAASIAEFGILQPLLVREEGTLDDGRQRYVVIAGGRRREAAGRAGLAALPVVVRGEARAQLRVLQLIENLQRQDLSALDEARAFQELIDLEDLTPPALAARLHLSAQHIRDRLRVLGDQLLADAVERRQIAATTARDIAQLPDEEQRPLRDRILAGEQVRTGDVAAVRAGLVEAGVINPRRKRARPEQGRDAAADRAPDAGSATGGVPARDGGEKQTAFVPPRAADAGPPSHSHPGPGSDLAALSGTLGAARASHEAPEPAGQTHAGRSVAGGMAGHDVDVGDVPALLAAFDGAGRARLERLLAGAAGLNWSCARLLDVLRQRGTGER